MKKMSGLGHKVYVTHIHLKEGENLKVYAGDTEGKKK